MDPINEDLFFGRRPGPRLLGAPCLGGGALFPLPDAGGPTAPEAGRGGEHPRLYALKLGIVISLLRLKYNYNS